MDTVCDIDMCAGCMACVNTCPKGAITICDSVKYYNAYIDSSKCVKCNMCHNICPNNSHVELYSPIEWYQGWATENIRKNGSSGGVASQIAIEFVKRRGKVCSCVFAEGEFRFRMVNSAKDIVGFAGSKYVKSNPKGVFKDIKEELKKGEVLFIGLPCQIAGLRNFLGKTNEANLYTIDLICHGTPSPTILNMALREYGVDISQSKNISFRNNNKYVLGNNGKTLVPLGVLDMYTIAFLYGFSYTKNCYSCRYATRRRVSDLTLGDSWGSELPDIEKEKGISLILCQSEKGKKLLELSNIYLTNVNLENAIAHNQQLKTPSVLPSNYLKFFDLIRSGKFKKAIYRCYFSKCIKQDLKSILFKLNLLK